MEIVEGINILATILQTVTNAAAQAVTVSATIKQAQSEGRTTFTDAEWAAIQATQASSRQALVDAISAALAAHGQ